MQLKWLNQLLDVPLATADGRRRARLLNILLLGIASLSLLALVAVLITQSVGTFTAQADSETYLPILVVLFGTGIIYVINRFWSIQIAGSLFLLFLTVVFFLADSPYESVWGRNMIILAIPVLMASVIMHSNASFVVAGLIGIIFSATALIESFDLNILGTFAFFAIALVSWLSSRTLETAVKDLRTINQELDQRVVERTAELQATNKQLENEIVEHKRTSEALAIARDQALEATRLKSQLLANVSHELRTPLGTILGFAEMLRAGIYGPIEDKQCETINKIIETNKSLTAIVSDLLDQAQIEAGKLHIQYTSFNPRELLHNMYEQLEMRAQEKNLALTYEVAPDIPATLQGDPDRLQQIAINLINNALKFTRQGSVSISVYLHDKANWALSVKDTGPGIPKKAQAYIFDAFRQVDGSITRKQEGFGLGLSIVKQLTAMMDGEIMLESVVGEGSVFTVIFPLAVQIEGTQI